MKKITQTIILFCVACAAFAEVKMNVLNKREEKIAEVAAFAAIGNQDRLEDALSSALDEGLEVETLKEILIQGYAYCGFPRSLNALNVFMVLLDKRGNKDAQGRKPSPLPSENKLSFGGENQTKLVGSPVKGRLYEFAPAIDEFLKAHLFGDIFGRDNLDWKTREIATIAILASMNGVESQLNGHIAIGKHNGLNDEQIREILKIAANAKGNFNTSPFPFGNENVAYSQYFSGKSWLASLTQNKELGVPISNVTFEPACRNDWHSHSGGQILIAVGGEGLYQEKGKPARRLLSGDVIEIAPNVIHWHGASQNSWFSHLAIACNPQFNENQWLEKVGDAEYLDAANSAER